MTRYWLAASLGTTLMTASVITLAYRYAPDVAWMLMGALGAVIAIALCTVCSTTKVQK